MRKVGNNYQNLQGPITIGAPAGGYETVGSINAQALFINGVAVTAGTGAGGVASVTGTANQVTASPTTGAVVVGLPQNVIIPTPASGIALAATNASGNVVVQANVIGTGTGLQVLGPAATFSNIFSGTQAGQSTWSMQFIASTNDIKLTTGTGSTTFGGSGNVTIAAPSSGQALTAAAAIDLGGILINGAQNNVSLTLNNTQAGATSNFRISSSATGSGFGAGNLVIGNNSTQNITLSAAGNVTINSPTSGTTLALTSVLGNNAITIAAPVGGPSAILISGAAASQLNFLNITQVGQTAWTLYQPASSSDIRFFAGADRVIFAAAGNVVINAPTIGQALSVTGVANSYAVAVTASATSGQSFGTLISGGTTSGDFALKVTNQSISTTFFTVSGDGGVQAGAPTGGNKGLGTINATGLFVNGVAVSTTAGGVTSVTGTANQVTASPTTGAVVVGLPQNVIIPTPASGTALNITGSTSASSSAVIITGGSTTQTPLSITAFAGANTPGISITGTTGGTGNLGIAIAAGNSSADTALFVASQGNAVTILRCFGDGSVTTGANSLQGPGTINASGIYQAGLLLFQTGTFTGTLTGCTTSPTAACTWTISGKTVTLSVPSTSATSNSTSMTMTGLPAAIQPATISTNVLSVVTDNGTNVAGMSGITAVSGTITFFRDVLATGGLSPTGFTATGTKGWPSFSITYSIQ